jgi:hypothetical protein
MKTRLLAALTVLVPTLAVAQAPDPNDPNAAPVEPAPTPPPPVPVPAAENPVIIVNPPAQQTTTYTTTEPQYETYTDTWNAPMFTSGALVFLGSYGASVVVAATSEDDVIDRGNDRLYVPVAGPWLALNDRPDCPVENESCDMETTKKVLLVADGVLQAGGVITMIAGLLSPTEHRVIRRPTYVSKKVTVSPSAGGNPGITLLGRF